MAVEILLPEFFIDFNGRIYTGGIAISDGKIIDVGDHVVSLNAPKVRLNNQVITPGFVNGHSHAFQRLLRGLVEQKTTTKGQQNFFTWREKMYALARNITGDILDIIVQFAYLEMLLAGFTHVAEFHYLHHEVDSEDPLILSRIIAKAAQSQKINLTLLECAYHRNNFDDPLKAEQRRFAFTSASEYLAFLAASHASIKNPYTRIGAAIHSVRAVPEDWFFLINEQAKLCNMPLHVHVSEQRGDVLTCVKARGMSPVALLHRHHLLSPGTTLIHATHLINDDIEFIVDSKATICLCPSTEKNLGDGVLPLQALKRRKVSFSIGTDQHVRLDPFDEVRSLEEQERLRTMTRLVLPSEGEYLHLALLPCLTKNGMTSLDQNFHGDTLIGQEANLLGIALPPEYDWHGPKAALDALIMAGCSADIKTVITRGEHVVDQGQSQFRDKEYLIKEIGKFFRQINLT